MAGIRRKRDGQILHSGAPRRGLLSRGRLWNIFRRLAVEWAHGEVGWAVLAEPSRTTYGAPKKAKNKSGGRYGTSREVPSTAARLPADLCLFALASLIVFVLSSIPHHPSSRPVIADIVHHGLRPRT